MIFGRGRTSYGADGAAEVLVCVNHRIGVDRASCGLRGGGAIADALEAGLRVACPGVHVLRTPCQNNCELGPSVRVLPNVELFSGDAARDVDAIVAAVKRRVDSAKENT